MQSSLSLYSRIFISVTMIAASPALGAITRDIYSEINVSGSIILQITDKNGASACANVWWITRVTGGVRQLGLLCGRHTIPIPNFLGISLASKLRASAGPDTVIKLRANEGVAKAITFSI